MLNDLFGPGNVAAIVVSSVAQSELNHGIASIVDAINRHNDLDSCTHPAPVASR